MTSSDEASRETTLKLERLRNWAKRIHVRESGVSRFVVTLENGYGRKLYGHGDSLEEAEAGALKWITKRKEP